MLSKNIEHVLLDSHSEADNAIRTVMTGVDVNVTAVTDSIKIGDEDGDFATITTVSPTVKGLDVVVQDISITHANDSIKVGDGSITATVTTVSGKNSLDVNVTQLPALPTGSNTIGAISNTSFASTQSGTWTVQPGNTPNTVAWKVDNSAVTQPISAVSLPLPTGAATAALQTQPGVDIGDVTINNASGASAVNIQDGGNSITVDGTVTVNPLTNSSVVKAQLQDNAGTAITVGQKPSTSSIPVVIASDQSVVLVREQNPSTASVTSVTSSATNVTLLTSNTSARQRIFHNDATKDMYLKFGATATTASYTYKVSSGAHLELPYPCYTGQIDAIWGTAPSGSVRCTEVT